MGILEELGGKISQTTQSAVKSTKEFAEVTKIKSLISDEQKRIRDAFVQIGEKYYEQYHDSTENEYSSICALVTESLEKIEKLKKDILVVKGIKNCPSCGEEISITTTFCGFCGYDTRKEQEDAEQEDTEQSSACPKCGKVLADGIKFCTGCGEKIT